MKTTKHLLFAILTMLFIACSSDDSDTSPRIEYPETITTIEAIFFRAGNTEVATLEHFPKEEAVVTYSLAVEPEEEIVQLFINETTGRISWTNGLQLGENMPFSVVASTAGGEEVREDMTINNPSSRTFVGTYNDDIPFQVTLMSDISVTIDEGFDGTISNESLIIVMGGASITIGFRMDDTDGDMVEDIVAFSGSYDDETRSIIGDWTIDFDGAAAGEDPVDQGDFQLTLVTEE